MSAGRFKKGRSGNPKGRPRAKAPDQPSAFGIVMDRVLTVVQGGQERELNVEEALQLKTYQDAVGGSRMAQRQILKMIAKREMALGARTTVFRRVELRAETDDPRNADEALVLLGIAERRDTPHPGLRLKAWAVDAALRRRGRPLLRNKDLSEVRRCVDDPSAIKWPTGVNG